MKHIHAIFLFTATLVLASAGCSRPCPSGFGGMKWERTGTPADSLTILLERQFYEAKDHDTIMESIGRLRAFARRCGGPLRRTLESRCHFYSARLLEREMRPDSAVGHIALARKLCDSAEYPYTLRRIDIKDKELNRDKGDNELRRHLDNLEYFRSVGDLPMEASVCIQIGNTLSSSYQPELALGYLRRADSISSLTGLTAWSRKNKINIAACLYGTGDTAAGNRIMENLLKDPEIQDDFGAYNIVLRNIFIHTGKSGYIHKAYRRTMEKDSTAPLNAVYEILLSLHYIEGDEKRDTALADIYGAKAFARLDDVADPGVKAQILISAAQRLVRQGKHDSAYICQSRYIMEKEASEKLKRPLEVLRIHNLKEINRVEAEKEMARQKYVARMLAISLVAVALMAVAVYIKRNLSHRLRMEEQERINGSLRSQLEIERYQRQFLAISLASEDTDRSLADIRQRLDDLRKDGKISESEIRQVDAVIRKHTARRDDWNRFRELFDKTHPLFLKNLKEAYPGLSETQVRLATYIHTGMDNKQIADFLNIRAESVKQSRWRLRSRMGLQPGESLEDALGRL
jgi:hypothetical protein